MGQLLPTEGVERDSDGLNFGQYVYDHRNRMVQIRQLDALGNLTETVLYAYDSSDHRIAKGVDSDADGIIDAAEGYIIDGDTMTAIIDDLGNAEQHFFHGAAVDEILAQESATGDVTWTLADGNKTVRDLAADVAGTTQVVNHRVYDSFGNLASQTNSAIDSIFGFTGREHDADAELIYYRDRWMDPAVGLFTSEDPSGFAGGDVNLASYVGNSPYDYTDPTGNSWLSKAWRKVTREVSRVINQVRGVIDEAIDDIGDFLQGTWDDTREFASEHPILTGVAALATGTWFVSAAGGFAAAGAKIGALASKAVGSISTSWAPASSGIGGTFSVNIGSFASLNAGAGISGTSAFASANVSILGLPISGIGKSAGVFGKTANPFASTLVGNFTDSVLTNTMSSNGYGQFSLPNNFVGGGSSNYSLISGKATGSTTVGSFASSVTRDTAYGFAMGQLAQTGIPTAFGAVSQGIQTYQGVSGAFRDVFAPPPPARTSTNSEPNRYTYNPNPEVSDWVESPADISGFYERTIDAWQSEDARNSMVGSGIPDIWGQNSISKPDLVFMDDFWSNISSGQIDDRYYEYVGGERYSTWDIFTGSFNAGVSATLSVADHSAGKVAGLAVGVDVPYESASFVGIASDGARGLGTGMKANVNAAAEIGTLGFVTEFWAVNEFDRSVGYDTANFSASIGMNVGVGLFTGGAANLRYAGAAGKAFNGASFAADTYRAGAQIYNDGGLTTGNALQSVLTATGVGDAVPVGSIARRLGFDASTGRLGELFADQRIGVNAPKGVGKHAWSPTYHEAVADSHHVIQHAAAKTGPQIPGRPKYSRSRAPGEQLDGPSTEIGSQHYRATRVQDQAGGGTYGAERRIGYKALRRADKTPEEARAIIERSDKYFIDELGWTKDTQLSRPGNRR